MFGLLALLALCTGCFTRNARLNAPGYQLYTLHSTKTWQMDLPEGRRFDASGLFLDPTRGILTESDQEAGVYQVHLPAGDSAQLTRIPDCFTPKQLAPFAHEKVGHYDCEGVTEDDAGRIYLCEEGNRWVLRWDPNTHKVERLNIDWSPVQRYFSHDRNASWEGIAVHGRALYLANERKSGRIIVVDLDTLKITDDFVLPAHFSWWFWDAHYSDLCWFDNALFILMREDHVILKVNPVSHKVLAEYSFKRMETARNVNYKKVIPIGVGVMEGLAMDSHNFWLCTDNNGKPRKQFPHDTRPTLFKCPRPDVP